MRLGVGVGVQHIKSAPSSMLGCLIGQEEDMFAIMYNLNVNNLAQRGKGSRGIKSSK